MKRYISGDVLVLRVIGEMELARLDAVHEIAVTVMHRYRHKNFGDAAAADNRGRGRLVGSLSAKRDTKQAGYTQTYHRELLACGMLCPSAQQIKHVGGQFQDSIQRFQRAARRAGEV